MTLRSCCLCLADLQVCCIISQFAIDGDADATGNGSLRRGVPRLPEFTTLKGRKGGKCMQPDYVILLLRLVLIHFFFF